VRPADVILVQAPARLHLGLFDLRGDLGRRFGGAGLALRRPSLLLEAAPAATLEAEGPEAPRVLAFARRFLAHHGLEAGARLRVRRAIPAHAGLGSGTQLALATARALASLTGRPQDAPSLAAAEGRARRSAVGTWAFECGGFILEGGRRSEGNAPGPLLARYPVPEHWRCVIAIPPVARGLNGAAEERAFRHLELPPPELVGEISRLVLMLLLPSLVEGDLAGFGRAVTEVQQRVGETFRAIQRAAYAHPLCADLIEHMLAAGAAGAGQSSWGPAVYGFVAGDAQATALVRQLRPLLGAGGQVFASGFDNTGARCWRSAQRTVRPAPVD
jgi:beta-ribofuranosylaminobenzene 5'-phosphate synthase